MNVSHIVVVTRDQASVTAIGMVMTHHQVVRTGLVIYLRPSGR